ncbi:MAG TPA: hypothetical protein VKB54_06940 [Solirubrobacteraceae bacterium]|nr:hypothetical protein [Solirubrobacteraceae bacterium]
MPPRKRVGRPTALTPELAERLVELLRAGSHPDVACKVVGIGRRTYYRWLARGQSNRARDRPYADLRDRIGQARAEAEARAVAQIARAGADDWRAAAWFLERGFPDRWGRPAERERLIEIPAPAEPAPAEDPFAEVDELAARRRTSGGP